MTLSHAAGGFAVGGLTFPTGGGKPTYHQTLIGGISVAALDAF